nr:FmdB family zinc ribbon protein [Candidatus Acidoferrales bacterium]
MPLYEYLCVRCKHKFERIDKFTARKTRKCPKCGDKAQRQLAAPAIQFKGAGWYVTDYGGKSSPDPKAEKASGSSASSSDKSEKSGSSEKSEKKESKAEKPAASKSKEK